MSNKKSRKLINIMLSAMMILGINSTQSYGQQTNNYGRNGVSYVLLSTDFSRPGIYRFNKLDGDVRDEYLTKNDKIKKPLFKINTINGKVSGLAANQTNNVFVLSAIEGAEFSDAPIGWLPTGIKFDENSSIYLSVAGPSDGGADNYWRTGYPAHHAWPKNGNSDSGQYWKRDQTYDGKTYEYGVRFGGPDGVKYLNGKDGARGCPIWDGTTKPTSTSNTAAIQHPSDPQKVILPSHVGALSYYLYGTKNEPAIEGLPMDGTNGRDLYIFTQANGAGYFKGDSKHNAGTMFGCIVRRFYQRRENSLNLYTGNDTTASSVPENQPMTQTQSNVLKTVDVKVREAYGKLCGDNCIDGGEIAGGDVETALSTVTVVSSTTGNRYGFNPLGVFKGSNSIDASLRVVKKDGKTETIDISTDDSGTTFSNKITNREYLKKNGKITPASIKTIGISSKFDNNADGLDYIYGSAADYFVVQDSWWGQGGIAYEYYKGTDGNPGKVVKIDYLNNPGQTASETLGDLDGKVDAIAIDGDGYLYALKTEEGPSDKDMEGINAVADPDTNSVKVNGEELKIEYTGDYTGWRRDKQNTSSDNETLNDGYEEINDGDEQAGDYKVATIKQNVYKAVKRYSQATGELGSEEDWGFMWAGYDTWTNKLKKTSSGYTWDYPIWRQNEGTKVSNLLGELAVVNIARPPVSVEGTENHYITVIDSDIQINKNLGKDYSVNQVIGEQDSLTFKVEGYKPSVKDTNGEVASFTNIGNLTISSGQELTGVKLNTIYNRDAYKENMIAYDEDNDGNKSGFPSSMFESNEYTTKVEWSIAQVENTEAVPLYNDSGAISNLVKLASDSIDVKEGSGEFKTLDYKFDQPGRYIVQAKVTYYYFDFNALKVDDRPTSLTFSTNSFITKPKLIQVYANSLLLNQSPSYITNITMRKNNNKTNFKVTDGDSKSDFDTIEGLPSKDNANKEGIFGSITISFDAQFFGESESNTAGNLNTFPGVGVWDYQYYKKLYGDLVGKIGVSTDDLTVSENRAYNHIGDGYTQATTYNPNVYNPGKLKGTHSNTDEYKAGTKVSGDPENKDLAFIQWALYLRPVTSQGNNNNDDLSNLIDPRGDLIATGTFADPDVMKEYQPKGCRKYHISKTINEINSRINTPRDPERYTLDLEIVYPRVNWLNNDLGANLNDGNNYFSSIVPFLEGGYAPVHVLSRISISGATSGVNQSFINYVSDEHKNANKPWQWFSSDDFSYFTLCVRDKEKPKFEDISVGLPYIETTGDGKTNASFSYRITDNNPFLSVTKFEDYTNVATLTDDDVLKYTDVMVQLPENKYFDTADYTDNKIFKKLTCSSQIAVIGEENNTSTFFFDNNYRLVATITKEVSSFLDSDYYSEGNKGQPIHEMIDREKKNEETSNKISEIKKENWTGTLNYSVIGKFYDGLGKDGNKSYHYMYNEALDNCSELPEYVIKNEIIETEKIDNVGVSTYLARLDNDPPSIQVELISQSDNRRWKFQLIEGVNDFVNLPKTADQLAPSTLNIESFHLDDVSVNPTKQTNDKIPGVASFSYDIKDSKGNSLASDSVNISDNNSGYSVKTTDVIKENIKEVVPEFRRAGRLLINVDIFDNCGYLNLGDNTKIVVKDNKDNVLLEKPIKTNASHNQTGAWVKYKDNPRGVFTVNLPMQVAENQPQITISVLASDLAGNTRELIIPVNLVESSFETRVLETKEERK